MKRIVGFMLFAVVLLSAGFLAITNTSSSTITEPSKWGGITHYLVNDSEQFTIDEAIRSPGSAWQNIDNGDVSLGYDTRTYWFKMHLPASENKMLLHVAYPLLD